MNICVCCGDVVDEGIEGVAGVEGKDGRCAECERERNRMIDMYCYSVI